MTRALIALLVIVTWWGSTSLIMRLVWLGPVARGRASVAAWFFALLALVGLAWTSRIDAPWASCLAFVCAIAVWGLHELLFLSGFVTGPRKEPCPPGASGYERFRLATATILHHELALAVTLVLIGGLTYGAIDRTGFVVFAALWTMRISAKLNLFLGVANVNEEFVPSHLRYLTTYFRRRRFNPLMPVSLAVGVGAVVYLLVTPGQVAGSSEIGRTVSAALVALGTLEHSFMIVHVRDGALWRWALPRDAKRVPRSGET